MTVTLSSYRYGNEFINSGPLGKASVREHESEAGEDSFQDKFSQDDRRSQVGL